MRGWLGFCFTFFSVLLFPHIALADTWRVPDVRAWRDEKQVRQFTGSSARGAVLGGIAAGDLGTDGVDEVVIAAGKGMEPRVSVRRADGSEIKSFLAYPADFRFGVSVAVGDVDADGKADIITAPQAGGTAPVKVFDANGKQKRVFAAEIPGGGLHPFGETHRFGITVAVADIDDDGIADLLLGSGPGGSGEVRIYHEDRGDFASIWPFGKDFVDGVSVSAVRDTERSVSLLAFGRMKGGSDVALYSGRDLERAIGRWQAFGKDMLGGVMPHFLQEPTGYTLVLAPLGFGGGAIRGYSLQGDLLWERLPYEKTFTGGILTTSGTFSAQGVATLLTAPTLPAFFPFLPDAKRIQVSLRQQRLYAMENGVLLHSHLISSGLAATPTPLGEFSILTKPLVVNYTRIYGAGDPRNYSYPNTKYNLMFKPRYYLHTAYWHNNFGAPMSHGCVNTTMTDAKWLYEWADIGTPVSITREAPSVTQMASAR